MSEKEKKIREILEKYQDWWVDSRWSTYNIEDIIKELVELI